MNVRWLLLFLLFAETFAADPGLGGTNILGTNQMALARAAASNTFVQFRPHITPATAPVLGFASTNELSQIRVGEPIVVYPVLLDRLKNYQQGQGVSNLLGAFDRVIAPLLVQTNVRSSVTLRLVSKALTWTNENLGQPRLAKDLTDTLSIIPPAEIDPTSVPFATDLPVFNIWFLAHRTANRELVFRATANLPPLGLTRGEVVPESVITNLSAIAKLYHGPP